MTLTEVRFRAVWPALMSRLRFAAQQARRATAGPALVRLVTGVSALAALVLAIPLSALGAWVSMLVPAAVAAAFFPRTRWITGVALLSLLGWLMTTIAFAEPVTPARVAGLASALYLMHTAAALAAVLPYDCSVAPGVLLRWFARQLGVLAVGLAVGLAGWAATGILTAVPTIIAPIVGSAVAAGLAGLLAWHLRRG
jgi:hypothetical protein